MYTQKITLKFTQNQSRIHIYHPPQSQKPRQKQINWSFRVNLTTKLKTVKATEESEKREKGNRIDEEEKNIDF